MKIYKGYELMKAIADGEIEEGSRFIYRNDIEEDEVVWNNENLKYEDNNECIMKYLTDLGFAKSTFELIDDKVDIDGIEELNDTCYDEEDMTSEEIDYYHNLTREQQNKILRAVKQLNKEIKSIKERSKNSK